MVYLPHPHTAYLLSRAVWETVSEWGLDGKILAVTTDNGANMVKAMRILVNEGKIKFHNRCAAHSIQLLVNIAIKILKNNKNNTTPKTDSCKDHIFDNESFEIYKDNNYIDDESELNLNTIEKIR